MCGVLALRSRTESQGWMKSVGLVTGVDERLSKLTSEKAAETDCVRRVSPPLEDGEPRVDEIGMSRD